MEYHVPSGDLHVTNRLVVGEPKVFGSFIEALWHNEGVKDSNRTPEKMQELQVLDGDKVLRFHGTEASEVMALISTNSCGNLEGRNQTMEWSTHEQSLVFRISLPTLVRQAVGGSTFGKDEQEWEDAVRDGTVKQVVNRRKFPLAFRNQRSWSGLFALHAFSAHMLRANPEYERLRCITRAVVTSVIAYGHWENPIAVGWKQAIDGIMNLEALSVSRNLRLQCKEGELACVYKLRKLFLKDNVDVAQGAKSALERFTMPPAPPDAFASLSVTLFQRTFLRFLQGASDDTRARWKRGFVDHQGGAGVYATRSDGGRAAEAHLIVALHRLSKGQNSPLTGVFGDMHTGDLSGLLAQVEKQETHLDEILDACVWFLDVTHKWPRCMYAIFPEREPKMRTFLLLDYAEQFVGRVVIQPLREMLRETPFCMAAFNGQKNPGTSFDAAAIAAAIAGDWQLFADASCATDGFDYEISTAVIEPLREFVPKAAFDCCVRALSPRLMSFTSSRPALGTIATFRATRELLFAPDGSPLVQLSPALRDMSERAFLSEFSAPALWPARVPEVRLKAHLQTICVAMTKHRVILVKSETGSGKTLLFSTLTNCIVQLPSIAALMLLKESLRHFGHEACVYYSLQQDEIRDWIPILTTSSYVPILAKKHPHRVVVLDEAEVPQEDPMLNIVAARTWRNSTVIMSATPDALRLGDGVHRLNLHTPSPHHVEQMDMSESEMCSFLATDQFNKALIVVHSEPFARRLAARLKGVAITSDVRASDVPLEELCRLNRILVSTNIVRSSVTLPGLSHVFDYGIKYVQLDFADQGFESLLITRVNEDEVTQLRGRVGRVSDGVFVRVKHDIDYHEHVDLVCQRMPKVASFLLDGGSLTDLPREVCQNSVLCETVTQKLCHALLGVQSRGLMPLYIKAARAMSENSGFCAMLTAVEQSGLLGRAQGLKNIQTLPEQNAYSAVKQLHATPMEQWPAQLPSVFKALSEVPAYRTQTSIITKWLSRPEDDERLEWSPRDMSQPLRSVPVFSPNDQLNNVSVQRFLSVFYWRSVAKANASGELYIGVFRDFSVRRLDSDPQVAVLLGLGLNDNTQSYTLAVPFSEADVETLRSTMRSFHIRVELSEEADLRMQMPTAASFSAKMLVSPADGPDMELCSLSGLHFLRAQKESKGRSRPKGILTLRRDDKRTIARPEDLPGILRSMLETVLKSCQEEPVISTKGMPMSWIVSFPVLNAVNYAASLGAMHICHAKDPTFDRNHANGFGDDLAACGSEMFCRLILKCRESLGLGTNVHATGFYHPSLKLPGEVALGVFCEVVYRLEDGSILAPPKPRALLSVASAMAPMNSVVSRKSFLPDVQDVMRAIQRNLPEVFAQLPQEEHQNEEAPFRSTYPRTLLRAVFMQSLGKTESVLTERAAKQFLEQVEPFVLGVAPSTKGTPVRVLPNGRHMPLVIGVGAAMRFADAISRARHSDNVQVGSTTSLDELLSPFTGQPFHSATQLAELGFPAQVIRARSSAWQGEENA